MCGTAVGGCSGAGGLLQGQDSDYGLSGGDEGRVGVGVSGSAACAAGAGLGAVFVDEWLRADCDGGGAVQLAAVPGELDRSSAFRVDAYELERAITR